MAETAEKATPVIEETPKVEESEVTNGSTEPKEETNGHVKNGDDAVAESSEGKAENGEAEAKSDEAKAENGEPKAENGEPKAENGHSNGDANGHQESEATKRKADDAGDAVPEPIPVSAEKIAKLSETEEKVEEKEAEATA
jgi:hypothetical protein